MLCAGALLAGCADGGADGQDGDVADDGGDDCNSYCDDEDDDDDEWDDDGGDTEEAPRCEHADCGPGGWCVDDFLEPDGCETVALAPPCDDLPTLEELSVEAPPIQEVWRHIAMGDFDADGSDDVVVAGVDNVAVLPSSGLAPTPSPRTGTPIDLAVGDVDDDGDLDLMVAYRDRFELDLGDGAGSLIRSDTFDSTLSIDAMSWGRLGDSASTWVALVHDEGAVTLVEVEASGQLRQFHVIEPAATVDGVSAAEFAALDPGSAPALVMTQQREVALRELTEPCCGDLPSIEGPRIQPLESVLVPRTDGSSDLVMFNDFGSWLLVETVRGASLADPAGIESAGGDQDLLRDSATGDLDGDGTQELLFLGQDEVVVARTQLSVDGSLGVACSSRVPVGNHPFEMATGDFTGNGRDEVALVGHLGVRLLTSG